MALRDNTYQKFGPLLLEALVDSLLEELNELRVNAGLQPRTKEYFLGKLNNNLNHLQPYNWMNEVP